MKHYLIITLCFLVQLISAQNNNIYILADTIDSKYLKDVFNEKYTRYTPTEREVELADSLAREYIEATKGDENRLTLRKDYERYNRQFIGYIDKKGNKKIYISSAYGDYCKKQDCINEIILMLDGGDYFFQIKIDLSNKKCYDFMINGVG